MASSSSTSTDATFDRFETALTSLEQDIDSLLSSQVDFRQADTLERCRLGVSLSYAVAASFYGYMRVQDVPTENHAVRTEMDRVASYLTKLQQQMRRRVDRVASEMKQDAASEAKKASSPKASKKKRKR